MSIEWICNNVFIQLLMNWGCFQFGDIINKPVMGIHQYISAWTLSFLLSKHIESKWIYYCIVGTGTVFCFLRNCLFSWSNTSLYIPISSMRVSIPLDPWCSGCNQPFKFQLLSNWWNNSLSLWFILDLSIDECYQAVLHVLISCIFIFLGEMLVHIIFLWSQES